MLLGGSVCIGFSYDTGTQLAFFKNQRPNEAVDVTAACVIPNVTLWVLTSGQMLVSPSIWLSYLCQDLGLSMAIDTLGSRLCTRRRLPCMSKGNGSKKLLTGLHGDS